MDDTMLAELGPERSPIRITLNSFNGKRTLDIRRYYFDKNAKEIRPTPKGIALNGEALEILKSVLKEREDELKNWLEAPDLGSDANTNAREQRQAANAAINAYRPYTVDIKDNRSKKLFSVETLGGLDSLAVNPSHPYFQEFERLMRTLDSGKEEGDETINRLRKILKLLFLAFSRSKELHAAGNDSTATLLDAVELHWSIFLKTYLEKDVCDE